jgi:endonuclease YncB( thermonuclease family)
MKASRLILVPPLILLVLSVPISSQVDAFTGKGVGVSDGDTISVIRGGRAVKARLHGIDYPGKG